MNLNIYLWGAALAWYTSELFNLERVDLQNNENSVEEWCQTLKNWFKKSAAVTLVSLTSIKYTITDAQNHWEPFIYVQTILCHVKSVNIESVENQLTFIYQNIITDLWAFVNPSTDTITVSQFIQTLKLKKDTWWDMHWHDESHKQCISSQCDCNWDCENWGPQFKKNRNGQYNSFHSNFLFQGQY